jgi:hypothetical protein
MMQETKIMQYYLRILPQRSKVTVENNCRARLPLSVPNNERRVGHIEDYTKELLQRSESMQSEELRP